MADADGDGWPSWRPAHCGRCDWRGLRGLPLARLHCAVVQVRWLLLAIVLFKLFLAIALFNLYLSVPIGARWACSCSSCSWQGSSTGHLHALIVELVGTFDVGIEGFAVDGRLTKTSGVVCSCCCAAVSEPCAALALRGLLAMPATRVDGWLCSWAGSSPVEPLSLPRALDAHDLVFI